MIAYELVLDNDIRQSTKEGLLPREAATTPPENESDSCKNEESST
jgi:hypothetical protein